jgi:hypothetical protein
MTRPPPPLSVSQFSKIDRKLIESRASANFGGADKELGEEAIEINKKKDRNTTNLDGTGGGWSRRITNIGVKKEGEEDENTMRQSLFRELRDGEAIGDGIYSKDEAMPAST